MGKAVGGVITVVVAGERRQAKGSWSFNLGRNMRTAVLGADGVHGFSEKPQVAFLEGEITLADTDNLAELVDQANAEVFLETANGKTYVWHEAWQAGEGTTQTEEGNTAVRYEAVSAEEV